MTNLASGGFFKIEVGALFSHRGRPIRIRRVLSLDSVVVQLLDTDETERVSTEELRPITEVTPRELQKPNTSDLEDYSDKDWTKAKEIYEVIEPLLIANRTRAQVEQAAIKAKVHPATVYEWIKLYSSSGQMSSLIPMARGRKKGTKLIDLDAELIIEQIIEEMYLDSQRLNAAEIIEAVREKCRDQKIKMPHPNTIRNRLASLPQDKVLRAQGFVDDANKISKAILGSFPGADGPLSVVQIDHTPLDLIVVDEETREPLKRPWLTLAVDVYSRMIVGIYISLDAPSYVAVGCCLSMAMLPKKDYLASLGISGRWPVYGKMQKVHCDNGKDFKGKNLTRACDQYSISLQLRPVKTPRYGGHIERMIGNVNRVVHKLPGTTFAKPADRKGYDSKKKAAFTLKEIEIHIVEWIVNQYHQKIHSALNMSPIRKWELAILGDDKHLGHGLPLIPPDPQKLVIDFLPITMRTVQNYGIQIGTVTYYSEVLNRWINAISPDDPKKKRLFICRTDPRHLSKIWFFDPEANQYFEIPYRNLSNPDISRAEYIETSRKLKQEGRENVDEDVIFGSIKRNRERTEHAIVQTTSAKRGRHSKAKKNKEREEVFTSTMNKSESTSLEERPIKERQKPRDELEDLFDAPVAPIRNVRISS